MPQTIVRVGSQNLGEVRLSIMLQGTSKRMYPTKNSVKPVRYWFPAGKASATNQVSTRSVRTHMCVLRQAFNFCVGNIAAIKEGEQVQKDDTGNDPPIDFAHQRFLIDATVVDVAGQTGIARAFKLIGRGEGIRLLLWADS